MKSKLLILFFIAFFALGIVKSSAFAQKNTTNDYYEYSLVPYTKFADQINIVNKIDSDVILIGSSVSINSEINGDTFIIAENIDVNGKINGSLRFIAGSEVVIRSYIDGSVSGIGPSLMLSSTGEVNRDVYGYFDKFSNQGRIGKNLNISLNSEARASNNGKIIGNLFYTNFKPILGERSFIEGGMFNIPDNENINDNPQIDIILGKLFHAASILIIFWAIKFIRRDSFNILSKKLNKLSIRTLFMGSMILLISIFIVPLMIISLVGFPFALIFSGLLFAIWYCSPIIGSLYIGNKIFSEKSDTTIRFIVALLLFDLITIAPIIGSLISMLVFTLTIGIVYEYIVPRKISHE